MLILNALAGVALGFWKPACLSTTAPTPGHQRTIFATFRVELEKQSPSSKDRLSLINLNDYGMVFVPHPF